MKIHVAGLNGVVPRSSFQDAGLVVLPRPVDVAKALPLAYGMAAVLLGMGVLLIYADVVNPVKLFQ